METNIFKRRDFWETTAVIVLTIIIGYFYLPKLPNTVATHFNINFEPDGYSSKYFAVFGIPGIMLIFNIIVWFVSLNAPNNEVVKTKAFKICVWIIPVITFILQLTVINYALTENINIIRIVPFLLGIMFILIGNYLPKCQQNYILGFRLPWTLDNKDNWKKTNRLGGYCLIIFGIYTMILSFITNIPFIITWLLLLFASVIIPTIYSYQLYKKGI